MAKKIVVDPFFDGAATPATNAAEDYAAIEDTDLNRVLPAGPGGLRGTVIPKAAAGGGTAPASTGTDRVRNELHIDPDIPGQSIVVNLDDLNADRINAALEETREVDPRIRISAVYNAIAGGTSTVTPQAEDDSAPAPQQVTEGAVGPLQVFNSSEAVKPFTEIARIPDKMSTTAPTEWVTFEIEGFGEHRAPYHRVIRSNSNLVLVYDTKCEGAQRFFPRTTDQPLGIHIAGESVAYYAHTTGIEFSDAGVDYCVLLIEREAPLSPESDDME